MYVVPLSWQSRTPKSHHLINHPCSRQVAAAHSATTFFHSVVRCPCLTLQHTGKPVPSTFHEPLSLPVLFQTSQTTATLSSLKFRTGSKLPASLVPGVSSRIVTWFTAQGFPVSSNRGFSNSYFFSLQFQFPLLLLRVLLQLSQTEM